MTDAVDRLISFEQAAEMLGLTLKTLEAAQVSKRFLLPLIYPSPRCRRVRLSDVQAVVRGERPVMLPGKLEPADKARLRVINEEKRIARVAAREAAASGATGAK